MLKSWNLDFSFYFCVSVHYARNAYVEKETRTGPKELLWSTSWVKFRRFKLIPLFLSIQKQYDKFY